MPDGFMPGIGPVDVGGRRTKSRKVRAADLFCGAGGFSTGLCRALAAQGVDVDLLCVNHWEVALDTHLRNHPFARHVCADLETARPEELVPDGVLDILLASPTCTYHSRARGGRPTSDQQRMDPWIVVRWLTTLRVKSLVVENVPEFMDWGPVDARNGKPIKRRKGEYFRAWIAAIEGIGGRVRYGVVNCADYGDATTRKRFFLIAWFDGRGGSYPDATHAPADRAAMLGLEPWRSARDHVIDFTIRSKSVFTRPKPLAPKTMARIVAGAIRYGWAWPYLHALRAYAERYGYDDLVQRLTGQLRRVQTSDSGMHAVCVRDGAFVLSPQSCGAPRDCDQPIPGITTTTSPWLVEPVLVTLRQHVVARDVGDPVPAIAAHGNHLGLAEGFLVPQFGEAPGQAPRTYGVSDPLPTVTSHGAGALVEPLIAPYYGGGSGLTAVTAAEPLPTVTTKARFGLVEPMLVQTDQTGSGGLGSRPVSDPLPTVVTKRNQVLVLGDVHPANTGELMQAAEQGRLFRGADGALYVVDICFRMLQNPELARATSFLDGDMGYEFAGTQAQITKQIGNAVPTRTARAMVMAALRLKAGRAAI